ncbi:MAG: hypothetical protein KC517_08505 [Bacteroidetes bacterium]|nr:hypothetical protein [Bacteroidota bacterium]
MILQHLNRYTTQFITSIVLVFSFCAISYAQPNTDNHDVKIIVPKSSTIQVSGETTESIVLSPQLPSDAVKPLNFESTVNNSLWLNYSAVSQEGKNIYVSIADGDLPAGIGLTVQASTPGDDGQGNFGESAGSITLSSVNQALVRGITTCFTGEGTNKGRQLAYELISNNQYQLINATPNATITVCYTITD